MFTRSSQVIVVLLVVFALPAFAIDKAKPTQAKLVSKSDRYLIHVVPRPQFPRLFNYEKQEKHCVTLKNGIVTHTSLESGQMKCLFVTGSDTVPGPPMGVDRMHHWTSLLAGIAAENVRIWILTWHASTVMMITGRQPHQPSYGNGKFRLTVFDAESGTKLASTLLEGEFPKSQPNESVESGPMKLSGSKITVFGQSWHYNANELRETK